MRELVSGVRELVTDEDERAYEGGDSYIRGSGQYMRHGSII